MKNNGNVKTEIPQRRGGERVPAEGEKKEVEWGGKGPFPSGTVRP